MERKRIKDYYGRSRGHTWAHHGNSWLYKCLVLFLVATCLAASGWYFTGTNQVAKAATNLTLTAYNISPRTSFAGGEITFSYTINNPGTSAQTVTLGSTIGGPIGGTVEWFNDSGTHPTTVSVTPGTATYTRGFRVSDSAKEGAYNVHWALWINGVEEINVYRSGYLNVVVAPTVTITFDDGYADIYDHGLPVLRDYGYEATLFALTGVTDVIGWPLMSLAQLQSLKAYGWEIGSHSVTHARLTDISQTQALAEINDSMDWLNDNGLGPVYSFAYPFGSADGNVMQMVADAGYLYGRTVIQGINDYGHSVSLSSAILWGNQYDNSLTEVKQYIDQAISQSRWAIVLCHGVVDDPSDYRTNSYYGWVTTNVLTELCEYLKDTGVPVKTFAQLEEGVVTSPTNHTPVANNNSYSVNEDVVLNVAAPGVLGNDTDADNDALTAVLVGNATHGNVNLNSNGSFTYTPAANYNGSDSFTYRATDGISNSNTATVTITVNAVNDVPVAVGDSYNVVTGNILSVPAPGVIGNDTDVDGNTLTATRLTLPSHGTLVFNSSGAFTYTPASGYTGTDSFTYRVNDGMVNSNTAVVTIGVTAAGGTSGTFGLDSGTNQWYEGSGVLCSQRFQNTVGTGTLTKLELNLVHGYSGNIRMGVYDDNNGMPSTLLVDAGEVAATDGWVSISGLNVPVTGDDYYWLVFNMSGSNVIGEIGPDPGPEGSSIWMDRAYGAFPSTFPELPDWGYGISHWPYIMRATVER